MKILRIFFLIVFIPSALFAETLYLKNGDVIETSYYWKEDSNKYGYWDSEGKTKYIDADLIDWNRKDQEKQPKVNGQQDIRGSKDFGRMQHFFSGFTPKDRECFKSLNCWANRYMDEAVKASKHIIELHAKNDFQWIEGDLFSRYKWKDADFGIISYVGGKIKFQNGFGGWSRYVYICDYDTINKKLINIKLIEGQLP